MSEKSTADMLRLLQTGTLEVEGLLPWSSNYTFLVRVIGDGADVEAVYKPRRGERPLWDFARGTLCQREQAAFIVSDALGWDLVPATVLRKGSKGLGSLQLFVQHDPERHYFTFEGEPVYRRQLQKIVLFDVIINNADRKGGHVLLEECDQSSQVSRLWAIDHGVSFHTDYKLRTVIWEFAGKPVPEDLLADLETFRKQLADNSALRSCLREMLTSMEVSALQRRLERLIQRRRFIKPGPGRHYPWPPV